LSNTRKLVLISPSIFPGTSGDTANWLELIIGFKRKGFNVILICPKHTQTRSFDEKMIKKDVKVKRIPFKPPRLMDIRKRRIIFIILRLILFYMIEFLTVMILLIQNHTKYVFIRHSKLTIHLWLLFKILRIKSIADGEVPTLSIDLNVPIWILKILDIYERTVLSSYTHFLVSTDSQRRSLILRGFPRSWIIHSNIGININKVPICNIKEIPRNTFGYFGTLEKWQNVDFLLKSWVEVAKQKPCARLFIIGDGSMKSNLQNLAQDLGVSDSVIFLNAVPREILWNTYFRLFRVVIIPRSSFYVPTLPSIKLIEALAAGKPVIATKVPGITDIVNEEDGVVLVDPDNEDRLASAILKIINNENIIYVLSKKALQASKRFDINSRIYNILNHLIYDDYP